MRLGVPDSKSINGELEFERDSGGRRDGKVTHGERGSRLFWSTRPVGEHVMRADVFCQVNS